MLEEVLDRVGVDRRERVMGQPGSVLVDAEHVAPCPVVAHARTALATEQVQYAGPHLASFVYSTRARRTTSDTVSPFSCARSFAACQMGSGTRTLRDVVPRA